MSAETGTVCVIGIWHLGACNAVGFAEKGFRVIGLELEDEAATKRLSDGIPPLFEPGLEDLMRKHLASGALEFDHRVGRAARADWVVIAHDSPVNEKDEVDITPVVEAAQAVAPHLQAATPLIINSQLPLGSSETIEASVKELNPDWRSGVVYTPENLRLGAAIQRFLEPDMIVLGANSDAAAASAADLYRDFPTEKVEVDLRTAEMVKHALNTFLATSITFINEIANLSERLGADSVAVGSALKLDRRIGERAFLRPGLGFSGGTLARDVQQLHKFADEHNYQALLLEAIKGINEGTFREVLLRLQERLGDLEGKTIGVLGLTYKPGTSTMRRSPALKLISLFRESGASCLGFDPKADQNEVASHSALFIRVATVDELAEGSDALVLVTEWPEFQELDFPQLAAQMARPLLIDSKNFFEPSVLEAAGFEYVGFGGYGRRQRRNA